MHALVVFESLWGNTEQLAREVAAGIGVDSCEIVDAASAPTQLAPDVDLLVVGGPTHAFSMSTASTRESARTQGAEHVPARGIREWIEAQPHVGRLVALGFQPAAKPVSFGVHAYSGPITDGEEERARRWGAQLAGARP